MSGKVHAITKRRLLRVARMYMGDATNAGLSTHGRYSAAINALGAICLADIGDDHDRILIDLWEASRYDVAAWPNEYQVQVVVSHVWGLLLPHGLS